MVYRGICTFAFVHSGGQGRQKDQREWGKMVEVIWVLYRGVCTFAFVYSCAFEWV